MKTRKFAPTLVGNALEDRSLLSGFGGGNFDFSRPVVTNPSLPAANINFTSNAYHQIETSIEGVAGTIAKNLGNTNAVLGQLGKITSKVPFGAALKSILATDLQTLQAGSTVDASAATAAVTSLYGDLLGRAPDGLALSVFVPQIQAGTTVKQLAGTLVTSSEFLSKNTAGSASVLESQTRLITALYSGVLGRSPDAGGLGYWVGQLNAGIDPRSVALSFVNSAEAASSTTSILQTVADPTPSTPSYYFGFPNADGSLPGPSRGTSMKAQVADLIFSDLNAYLDQGEGVSFNVLKSHLSYSTDVYLTFNGRVK